MGGETCPEMELNPSPFKIRHGRKLGLDLFALLDTNFY